MKITDNSNVGIASRATCKIIAVDDAKWGVGILFAIQTCGFRGRGGSDDGFRERPFSQGAHLLAALATARALDAG